MLKQAIIAAAVAASTLGIALANGGTYVPAPACVHTCYVGVAISRDWFNFTVNRYNNLFVPSFGTHSVNYGTSGWDGELNGGIGWVFQQHYYAGLEVFGDVSNANVHIGRVGGIFFGFDGGNIRYRYSLGIDFVPGVKISDSTMLYGKIGYVYGNFSHNLNNGLSPFFLGNNNGSRNFGRSGLQLGVGLGTMVTNNVSVDIEYNWDYFSNSGNNNNNGFNFIGFNTGNRIKHIYVDTVKLGVAYHFMSA